MSKLSNYLSKKGAFARGKKARAKRDILAKRLRHKKGIDEPFGLATYLVRKGAKVKGPAVEREFAEQKRMAKRS